MLGDHGLGSCCFDASHGQVADLSFQEVMPSHTSLTMPQSNKSVRSWPASPILLGIDHFLAMFAVGVLSSIVGGRYVCQVPACFVLVMPMGWLLEHWAVPFPSVEIGIAASVAGLARCAGSFCAGGAKASRFRCSRGGALFHGYAHGSEMPLDVILFNMCLAS
jgi:hydrogenase/urease accessory protein HupE